MAEVVEQASVVLAESELNERALVKRPDADSARQVMDIEVLPPDSVSGIEERASLWKTRLVPLFVTVVDLAVRDVLPIVLQRLSRTSLTTTASAGAGVPTEPMAAAATPVTPIEAGPRRHRARRRGAG